MSASLISAAASTIEVTSPLLPSEVILDLLRKLSKEKDEKLKQEYLKELTEGLKEFPYLDFSSQEINDMDITYLSTCLVNNKILEDLNFNNNHIGDKGVEQLMQALIGNKKLRSLRLNSNQITHVGASSVSKLLINNPTLKRMALCGNKINDLGMQYLAQTLKDSNALEELYLSGNNITDIGIKFLSEIFNNNKRLKALYIDENLVTIAGVENIATMLKSMSLEYLDLSSNYLCMGITDKWHVESEILRQGLQSKGMTDKLQLEREVRLQTLKTKNQVIADESFIDKIPERLATLGSIMLQSINLSFSKIKDMHIKHIAITLKSNAILQKLILANNAISDEGVEYLGKALASNTTLQSLDLSANSIGDIGAEYIAEVLTKNKCLQDLDLSSNKVGILGARAFLGALSKNRTLQGLKIYQYQDVYNPCSERDVKKLRQFEQLKELTEHNKTLQEKLTLSWSMAGICIAFSRANIRTEKDKPVLHIFNNSITTLIPYIGAMAGIIKMPQMNMEKFLGYDSDKKTYGK